MDESMKATMTNPGGEYDSKTWKTKDPREIRRDFALIIILLPLHFKNFIEPIDSEFAQRTDHL